MNVPKTNQKGFTIIEVVLVLAIAALIFLMVFIALPALQRGQRDTQRKSDVARIATQVSNYASANRGTVPAALTGTFSTNYLGGTTSTAGTEYKDPSTGNGYKMLGAGTVPKNVGEVGYQQKASCATDGTGGFVGAPNANQYAVSIYLEGTKAPYCVDSK